jgi:hypothetical protein
MSKGVCIKRVVRAGLILLFAPLVGCTVLPVPSGTPGVIHFPTVESADWVTSMGSVCIEVEQSYTGLSSYTEPIAEELQGILSRIGVQATIGEGAGCEAVLSVTLHFTPMAEDVIGSISDCYLDAEATGEATISAAGYRTITLPLKHSKTRGFFGMTVISECPTQPDQAPFVAAWADVVAQMLREWWGSPALMSALKADTYALRRAATYQLTSIGPEASGAIPVLAEMLGDGDPQTREAAAEALGAFGPAAAEAVPALIEAINDSDEYVQYEVIEALGNIGDSQAVPALIEALHHSNDYARYVAAGALEKMGPAAAPAIPDLIDGIDDEFAQVGWTAVDALGAIGPEADEAIPVLIKLLEDEDWSPHFPQADALESISGQDFGENAAAWRQWWESQP